jgi:CDP-diacylglycerol--glycerol-3-phosphate 3-phosphatidyltransferase
MSLANKITLLRIILIPLLILFIYIDIDYNYLFAALIFLLCSITDALDGYVARKQNTVSIFGKVFDPVADKVLVFSALIPFVEIGLLPAWVVIILVSREFILSGFRIVHAKYGDNVIAASWLGKTKTILQDTFIVMIFLQPYLIFLKTYYITWIVIILSIIFAIWSMLDYIIKNSKSLDFNGGNK